MAYLQEPLDIALKDAPGALPTPDTLLMIARVTRRRLLALQQGGALALTSVRRAHAWVAEQRAPFRAPALEAA